MDQERKERLLSKLKKCMALSASSEAHEAAAALRQAQALMRELNMTEADLLGLEVEETLVKTREGFSSAKGCATLSRLVAIIEAAFGVEAVTECNPGSARRANIRYFGTAGRAQLAEYAHKVVWRAMEASWAKHLEENPWLKGDVGKRQAFHTGWLRAVRSKIEAIAPTENEARALKARKDAKYGALKTVTPKNKGRTDMGALLGGMAAGANFDLHRPMGESRAAIEHKGS